MASKSKDDIFVKCISCTHASYMQWFENPIIADCHILHERMVAESKRVCKLYNKSSITNPEVTHYDSYQ